MRAIAIILFAVVNLSIVFSCSGTLGQLVFGEDVGHCEGLYCHSSEEEHDDDQSSEEKACSPFCVCDCCCVPIEVFKFSPFFHFLPQHSIELAQEHDESPVLISFSIWHPPRS